MFSFIEWRNSNDPGFQWKPPKSQLYEGQGFTNPWNNNFELRMLGLLWNPEQAIDVWMLMCNFFVFASMIEYAFAQLLIRMKECIADVISQSHWLQSSTDF